MSNSKFLDILSSGTVLLADGAMGTLLHGRGVGFDQCFDELNLTDPAVVAEVHREYIEAGAEMILQSERFGSPSYHTQFFTTDVEKYCADEPVENERLENDEMLTFLNCNGTDRAFDESLIGPIGVEALTAVEPGTEVSFVEQTSSSGYIFPATVFATVAGLDPETDINALFAGSHDASVIAVCMGQAEIGVSFDDARQDAITDCDVAGTVVTFANGPEIPNDGMAVAGDLSDELKASIKQAMLDYAETEEGVAVLESIYNITAFAEGRESGNEL